MPKFAKFSAALLIALSLSAQSNPNSGRIAAAMQKMIDAQEVAGAVTLVATRQGISHFAAIGQTSPARAQPLRKNAIFWIASMTKPITGAAILMLQDEGKLSVDDPVAKHLPEFAQLRTPSGAPANLTLKHLMTHTSGLAEATAAEFKAARNLAELIPASLSKPMQFAPGSRWQYCQSGINTLGRIIEVVSGRPFEQFLAERLFRPLKMKDTTFYLSAKQLPRLATAARREADGRLTASPIAFLQDKSPTDRDRVPAPNGGLFSTASDYARFARMILNNGTLDGRRYLSPEAIRQMTTVQSGDLRTGFTPGHAWGLTFCLVRQPQGVSAMLSPGTHGHGGAYGTQAWIDPTQGIALLLMVQRANFPNSDDSPVRLAFQTAALEK
jgi:CubicO group peptidase (beta-lactamase class C family)